MGANYWLKWNKLPLVKSIVAEGPDGKILGFASGTPFPNSSYRIGPLYADSFDIGMALINELLQHAEMIKNQAKIEKIAFRVPSNNEKMIKFLTSLGFKLEVVINRTYTKRDEVMVPLPDITFAVATL